MLIRREITFKDLKLKKHKKLRMAEMAAQRNAIFGKPTMADEQWALLVTTGEPDFIFCPGTVGA